MAERNKVQNEICTYQQLPRRETTKKRLLCRGAPWRNFDLHNLQAGMQEGEVKPTTLHTNNPAAQTHKCRAKRHPPTSATAHNREIIHNNARRARRYGNVKSIDIATGESDTALRLFFYSYDTALCGL